MSIITTDHRHYQSIAEAIRTQTGKETTYKPEDMSAGVGEVYASGFEQGKPVGFGDGYTKGHKDGYDVGKEEGETIGIGSGYTMCYDSFWNDYQKNGSRANYWHGFSGWGWTKGNLKPKYKITFAEANNGVQNATGMFYRCCQNTGVADERIDFSAIADKFDFSGLKSARNLFDSCAMINITADLSNVEIAQNAFAQNWGGFKDNVTIKVSEKMTNCAGMFAYCSGLTTLTFTEDSVIACNGLDVSASTGLTHDSIMSIVKALQDKSGIGGTGSVTFGATNLAKLTDSEKAIATQKGWTLA